MKNKTNIPTVVGEITSEADTNSHTYLMSDGSKQTIYTATTNANSGIMPLSDMDGNDDFYLSFSSPQESIEPGIYGIGRTEDFDINDMYTHFCQGFQISFNLPSVPRGAKLKKAELRLFQKDYSIFEESFVVTVNKKVGYGEIYVTSFVATADTTEHVLDISSAIEDAFENGETTVILDFSGITYIHGMLKIYGDVLEYFPTLTLSYEHSYSTETTSSSASNSLTPALDLINDLYTGHTVIEHKDFEWNGELMPISLRHIYDGTLKDLQYTKTPLIELNVADFSAMKLGLGWKLDIMQSMIQKSLYIDNVLWPVYIYTDGDGNETYFIPSIGDLTIYHAVDDESIVYDSVNKIITWGNLEYKFENERLVEICDTDRNVSVNVVYANEEADGYAEGQLMYISDGAGRKFDFAYNSDGYLTSITAPDKSSMEYEYYDNGTLTSITRRGSLKNESGEYIVQSGDDEFCYMMRFNYSNFLPNSITTYKTAAVKEKQIQYTYSNDGKLEKILKKYNFDKNNQTFTDGGQIEYIYSTNCTQVMVTEPIDEGSVGRARTVYSFDANGNITSAYATLNDVEKFEHHGGTTPFNPYRANEGHVGFTTENLLRDPTFESTNVWKREIDDETLPSECVSQVETNAYYGKRSLIVSTTNASSFEECYLQQISSLPAGTYTFSAYVKVENDFNFTGETSGLLADGVYLGAMSNSEMLNVSESVGKSEVGFDRIGVTFTLAEATDVILAINANGAGLAYVSAPQLEEADWFNEVNLIEDDFAKWEKFGNISVEATEGFGKSGCVDILGSGYLRRTYIPKSDASTLETFVFSAWGKSIGVSNESEHTLRAVINYADGTSESGDGLCSYFNLNNIWNKAEVYIAKTKFLPVTSIDLYCKCDRSTMGAFYFDDISLVRTSIETGLGAEDFVTETEDDTSTDTDEQEGFTEVTDSRGNVLTETIFKDGCEGALYRTFAYSENGNNRISETDHRGNVVSYAYDGETSNVVRITDRCGKTTSYTYDAHGRLERAEKTFGTIENTETHIASVNYEYDANGKMCKIINGYTDAPSSSNVAYNFEYNNAGLLTNAANMISYEYRANTGRLKKMTYANGWTATLTYDRFGRIIGEKWEKDNVVKNEYAYAYDKAGNLVRSIDKTGHKEYTYTYRDNAVTKLRECNVPTIDDGSVTSRIPVNTIYYTYGNDGQLSKKEYTSSDLTAEYSSGENTSAVTHTRQGAEIDTVTETRDHLGRVTKRKVEAGNYTLSHDYTYHAGAVSEVHTENNKVPSTPTTNLVKKVTVGGRTFSYEYDNEERIVSCVDSYGRNYSYTYDETGKLIREVNNGTASAYVYDIMGNVTKRGHWDIENNSFIYDDSYIELSYSTDNCDRIDTVRKNNGTTSSVNVLEYDTLGNPTKYKNGETLAWEKGRQLVSYGDSSYTYNANGIRTSKTVPSGVVYNYELEGSKIVKITYGENVIVPLYDANDSPIGMIYNTTPYWYVKTLQGDIIAIKDSTGTDIVRYSYNAWGKVTVNRDTSGFNLASRNPFLYRGYLYDYDTKLYYLNSRYYDPELGRFLNADEPTFIGAGNSLSPNAYAYCDNDPVNMADKSGYGGIETLLDILGKSADVLKTFIEMIGNMYNKEKEELLSIVGRLTKKQSIRLSDINSLQVQTRKITRRLGLAGLAISILTIFIGLSGNGPVENIAYFFADIFVLFVEMGINKIVETVVRAIPYFGILLSFATGILIGYLISKFFNEDRMNRIKKKFYGYVKNINISFSKWIKYAAKSLTA